MTPLRIFAIKATHNVDFARFSQPLNGFPHCFQHIVESAVEKKKGILPANLPALEPAASVSSTNQTTSYFHFFQARTWIFHDFFHICMFSTPQNFHFFHCYLYFHISTFFPHPSCGREMSQHARKNLLFHKLTSSTTTILFLISISSHLSSASRNLTVHPWKTRHL